MNIDLSPLTGGTILFLIVFARVGTLMMFMPALGERMIPMRTRLTFALFLSLALSLSLKEHLPVLPQHISGVLILFVREIFIGLGLGLLIQLIFSALHMAGTMIAFQTGLSFAQTADPSSGRQDSLFISFFNMLALCLIFATDLHHLFLQSIYDSYGLWPASGTSFLLGDFSKSFVSLLAGSFKMAVGLASPFIAFGLVFYLGLGIVSRLIPQIQIFFLAMPLGIGLGLLLMMVLTTSMMMVYLNHLKDGLALFLN